MAVRHRIRADGFGKTKVMKLTARRVIIEFCKECVGFNANEEILHLVFEAIVESENMQIYRTLKLNEMIRDFCHEK